MSRSTLKSSRFLCRAARHYESLPDLVTESTLLRKWAFKDYARSRIRVWPTKQDTWVLMTYLEEQKAVGR